MQQPLTMSSAGNGNSLGSSAHTWFWWKSDKIMAKPLCYCQWHIYRQRRRLCCNCIWWRYVQHKFCWTHHAENLMCMSRLRQNLRMRLIYPRNTILQLPSSGQKRGHRPRVQEQVNPAICIGWHGWTINYERERLAWTQRHSVAC